jgi:hypothetical protein
MIINKLSNVRSHLSKYIYGRQHDDDDVYLNKLQTKGVKKYILYMYNVDQPIRHK